MTRRIRTIAFGRVGVLVGSLAATWILCDCVLAQTNESTRPVVVPLAQEWPLALPSHHVQGLAASAEHFWISTVDRRERKGWILRIDRETLKTVAARDITDGLRYHPGGIQEIGGALWVPLAEYRSRSSTTVLKLDPTTLETLGSFAWDDHLGAIASDGKGTLFAANWDARVVYFFDETGKLKEKRDNPTGVAYQDVDYYDGLLFGCGLTRIDDAKAAVVDALDPATLELKVRYVLKGGEVVGDREFGREGFAKLYEDFFVLPDDGPQTTIYRFGLPAR